MSMDVPKLRFKDDDGREFRDWKEKELGDVIEQMQSGVSRLLNDSDIGLPVIRSTNLIDGKLNISDLKYWHTIDNQGVNLENYFLKEGDLLVNFINSLAQIGKVAIYEDLLKRKTIFTTNILRLSFKKDVNFRFIFCFFQTNDYEQHIQAITKPAVNQASFTTKEFKTLKIPLPSFPEQTKIANFLTAIDEKITQLTQKHDLLKQYKKGVMQQIFSQKLRFKDDDGREFPGWEERELRDICDLITKGTTPTSVGHEFKTRGINFIKIESLEANGKLIKEKLGFIDSDAHAKLLRSQLKINDILFSIAGALGRVAIVTSEFLPANTNQALAIIRLSKKQYLNTRYIFYALTNDGIKKFIESISVQLAQANLSLKDIGDLVISLPPEEEQTKIANFLTAIDDKITHTQTQLEAVKLYKKGLLQQMFV